MEEDFLLRRKPSYDLAKAFRPISLASCTLKTLEKIIDRHIRESVLTEVPQHPNQHAYQKGKSCKTALHELVRQIEIAIDYKEIALAVFLDIEGAFDNTNIDSIVSKLDAKGAKNTLTKWINNMLRGRIVSTLYKEHWPK